MTLAMMLPTAGPMILTYAEIADTAARKARAGGVAAGPDRGLCRGVARLCAASRRRCNSRWRAPACSMAAASGRLIGGTIFLGAGLYQFSALKQACLTLCQRPFPFFFSNWTTEPSGVFRLGLRQGMLCLGCCWAMMLVMFAVGAMNVVWMAALGVLMTIEKLTTTARFSEALGLRVRRGRLWHGRVVGGVGGCDGLERRAARHRCLVAQGRADAVVQLRGVLPVRAVARPERADRRLLPDLGLRAHRRGPFRRHRSRRREVRLHGGNSGQARPRQLDRGAVRRRQGVGAGDARR